ncbi:Uncharacterised protein [Mycobacteroides abscessus subsp. abscessus]|nr:Uncharacterised protein [Mycobacteroides abscessus subsp. abscessus]SKV88140.1 Uncharacterised protein [Mycobacteroides abscessus subsp. abscessus]SLE89836.1 Uncharacterised protein [Mycobacteroides abscessus subsp. massiliense]
MLGDLTVVLEHALGQAGNQRQDGHFFCRNIFDGNNIQGVAERVIPAAGDTSERMLARAAQLLPYRQTRITQAGVR